MAKKGKEKEAAADEVEEKEDPKGKAPAGDEAADGAEGAEGAEGEGGGKKSKKKMIIIGVAALVVLLAAGAGLYFSGVLGGSHEASESTELGKDGKPIPKAVFYTLPEFLVNLNNTGKQSSFLKTTIILEVADPADVSNIEANLPRLQDMVNTYLRELRPSDLSGSAGIQRLREEMLLRANKALSPVKINDVLFKTIVVQ